MSGSNGCTLDPPQRLPAALRRINWRFCGFALLVLSGIILLAVVGMVAVSSQPRFCGSCHVMAPYFESWQTSSHNQVACVECHIPPGLYSEVEKKKEALSMVVSYFTGTYGTNPWAEVEDAACLRCHQRRLLAGKEVYKGILFDHGPHLNELRRGEKLRCTSCHSQIVQGSHIRVTFSTCVLCHFKKQPIDQGTARCTLCHAVPDTVIKKGNLSFDHADVERFDMPCSACHAHVVEGDGSAPQQRCYVCHNDQTSLARYDDQPELHRIHVSEHKVECLHCHTEIRHGDFERRLEIGGASCNTCHEGGHSPQRDLYVGIGGKGVEPRPSGMYRAGIYCQGCHFLSRPQGSGHVKGATDISCMSCHGPRYSSMLERWQALLDDRLLQSRSELASARRLLDGVSLQTLRDVEDNIRLVEQGHGVHNIDYALDILAANHAMLNRSLVATGHAALKSIWPSVPYQTPCLRCHQGIETQAGPFAGREFAHRSHVVERGIECDACHRPHQDRPQGEVVREGVECISCHHAPERDPGVRCAQCHSTITDRVIAYEGEEFAHALHVEEEELECTDCHSVAARPGLKLDFCADCHD